MSDAAANLMTVDEFLVWGEEREGRWELRDGVVVAMSPERVLHLETKGNAFSSLSDAIRGARAPCRVYPNGATVRISRRTAFEPDALARCGPPLPPDALELPDPIVVVEVLSPSTEAYDRGAKVEGYFSLASVMHYLIVDADREKIVHHKRGAGEMIETRILASDPLRLDPPGLELSVESFFAPG
jgi:Uma2 family endonuclease